MSFWKSKRVLVTGGSGFLGRYVVRGLRQRGCKAVFTPTHTKFDLKYVPDIEAMYTKTNPDIVIHLAATVGGIFVNRLYPGKFFYENLIMGAQMMEMGRLTGVEKFVNIGTVCSYPKLTPVPFKEKNLWRGYPEETNAPYGIAKKALLTMSQAYRRQYGFNSIYLIPVNLYGPGDNFDPKYSHVIPALIGKLMQHERTVIVWGTGEASREFLYVEDAAEGILLATEYYNKPDPINLGTGKEIKIKELVRLLVYLTEFKGQVVWNRSMPDGQPRRCLDITKARKEFGFEAKTTLTEGLKRTIEWYRERK